MFRRYYILAKIFAITIPLISGNALAYMPQAPNSPSGYDEYRTADGSSCRSSVGGNIQIYGGMYESQEQYYSLSNNKGFHVGVAYSLGGGKRIDCSRIQEIDTRRAELELRKLEAEIKALEKIREMQLLNTEGLLPPLTR